MKFSFKGIILNCLFIQTIALLDSLESDDSIDQEKLESILERLFLNRNEPANLKQNELYGTKKNEKSCYEVMSVDGNKIIHSKQSILNGASFIDIKYIPKSVDTNMILHELCMDYCCQYETCDTSLLSTQAGEKGYRCYLFSCMDKCLFVRHDNYDTMQMNYLLKNGTLPLAETTTKVNTQTTSPKGKNNVLKCHDLQFTCKTSQTCIPIYDVCNSFNDCDDGSDEFKCEKESSTKKNLRSDQNDHEKQDKLKPQHFFKTNYRSFRIDDILNDIFEQENDEYEDKNSLKKNENIRFHDNHLKDDDILTTISSTKQTVSSTKRQESPSNFNFLSIKHGLSINTAITIILVIVSVSLIIVFCACLIVNITNSKRRVKLPGFKRLRNESIDADHENEDYLINGMYL